MTLFIRNLVLVMCLPQLAGASELFLTSVKQPLFLLESGAEVEIRIADVPFVTGYADPEWRFSAITKPFVPSKDESWKEPHDVNAASLYGITVEGTYVGGTEDVLVKVDVSRAMVPEDYPFSVEQVLDTVITCIKLMYPPRPKEEGTLKIEVIRS